jgi:hypothetical protein
MAYEGPAQFVPGLVAGAGLTADAVQFKFVYLSAERTASLISNPETQAPVGVLQAPVKATGDPVTVLSLGVSKVRVGTGTPSAGNILGSDTDGQAVVRAVTATTYYTAGRFIETGTTDGTIVAALIDCINPTFAK